MVGLGKDGVGIRAPCLISIVVDRRQALDHTTPITHGQFNPDAPFLASLVADEEAVHSIPTPRANSTTKQLRVANARQSYER